MAIDSERSAILPYALVGAVATAVHYSILAVLTEIAAVAPGYATGVGGLFGALVAYRLNRDVTFMSVVPHRQAAPRFLLIAAFGTALSVAIVSAGTTYTQCHYLAWQVGATLAALFLTYAFNRQWTFS
jgi:putative flippase GtrA